MDPALRKLCAHMFMVGFPGDAPTTGTLELIAEGIFGAILFARNIGTVEQTHELIASLKRGAGRPFLLAVDQEGGRVARLRGAPFTALPPMRTIGALRDPALARRVGELLALELTALGFDFDFAPVLDVDTNPKNPVIGDRALHSEPHAVAELGVALAQGLEDGGVASCGKHFPGHGDTLQDSHLTLPRLPHPLARLRAIELQPFAAYAAAKLSSMMTAHVLFEPIDPSVPATMSRALLTDLLRGELGFEGVIVSDDLEMKAITHRYTLEEAVVKGTLAGVDLFLVCHHDDVQRRALEALVQAVAAGEVPRARIEDANARLEQLARRFYHPPGDERALLGSARHRELARELPVGDVGPDPTTRAS